MSVDTGGPAFPAFVNQYDYGYEKERPATVEYGMTLRDYFAAKALVGMMAVLTNPSDIHKAMNKAGVSHPQDLFAKNAYDMADAMLKARQ